MALIQLAYKQTISAASQTPFEQQVFSATFAEFCLQQQSFSKGQELYSWPSIRSAFPKSNPALPFKVSFAIKGPAPTFLLRMSPECSVCSYFAPIA